MKSIAKNKKKNFGGTVGISSLIPWRCLMLWIRPINFLSDFLKIQLIITILQKIGLHIFIATSLHLGYTVQYCDDNA